MEIPILSSSGDRVYYVTKNTDGDWSCNCPAGIIGKECRHIRKARTPNMEVNTRHIKFASSLNEVMELPKLDEEVDIMVHGQVVKVEQRNNQDGTFDLIATVKPYSIQYGKEQEN